MTWNLDKISPITSNKSVISVEDMDLCMESGYHLMNWNPGFEEKLPVHVRESAFVDPNTFKIWYKTIAISTNSIIFPTPEGTWAVNTFKNISDNEAENFEIVRTVPNVGKQALDIADEVTFKIFINAYDEFQKRNNEN